MTEVIYTILLRELKHAESLLSELTTDLGYEAYMGVHLARINIETLCRLEERKHSAHMLGQRDAA